MGEISLPAAWRLRDQYLRFTGEKCNDCENYIFPPRDVCPICGAHGVIYKALISSETYPETAASRFSK